MSADRELLELAAKAAGIEAVRSRFDDPLNVDFLVVTSVRNATERFGPWNPLTDDGDALRLAVKLNLDIHFWPEHTDPWVEAMAQDELLGSDPYAATRKAIVRAAAEIGRAAK